MSEGKVKEEKKRLFSPTEAAAYLGISPHTLKTNYRERIPPKKITGRIIRYDKRVLDKFIDELPAC